MTLNAPTRLPIDQSRFAHIPPNWFASVMGTGIVAVAAAGLPYQPPGLRVAAEAFWLLAATVLVLVTLATVAHWRRFPDNARAHLRNPVLAHFYGAAPMALLTVGAGALLVGRDLIGIRAAIDLDWLLWSLGTLGGLAVFALIPYLAITRHGSRARDAFGGWLMPVVPPMVSASTGALLVPHACAALRHPLLLGCYVLFGLSLLASVAVIVLIMRAGPAGLVPAGLVPTVWIVLGPLGQSTTAANLLGGVAGGAGVTGNGPHEFGVRYGVIVWIVAMLWLTQAVRRTTGQARRGLPFTLAWWSFTFPLGTCVTGASALALHTGFAGFRIAAALLFSALVLAWALVAARTVRGVYSRSLLAP
jgi:C4-dicarboxylate transporter/malic acid transport protein